ncbi:NitT/TauT family transport system permease protein [Tistlia consotensis]|uniref:NitT/TauT family transport system permease protein n=1 Tax=Tistlia consotensis USBA 355 TaxID=560819 RepID=A0A1Y6CQN8_9PROT|nr:ABC transporter permease subunit [Tistlia consotensis]SMF81622.1 NitT/TauT family transport system permease protein [Tistlia consotensis USBA 355]SNS24269.1 NitT/TauT family transport system permease protein [Tistlia consotensis]
MTYPIPPVSVEKSQRALTLLDLVAVLLVLGALVFLAEASHGLAQPLPEPGVSPITLDPAALPGYAARTTLRMLAAMGLSLLFTFTYATWAAKSRRAEFVLIPLLDILQSVPILGFISVTVVFFMSLAPGRMLGAEFAAVFAIFTSQAWNMAFSFYQSLRTVPEELGEAARSFRLSPWMRFWRLEVPFAMPALVWNMMMSMSGGWFFVVASEAISVGDTTVTLPGIGSYIALAIEHRDLGAIGWAISTMFVVILIYDQLLFRPLVAWADRFRFEQEMGVTPPGSWVLTALRRSRLVVRATAPFGAAWRWSYRLSTRAGNQGVMGGRQGRRGRRVDRIWHAAVVAVAALALWKIAQFVLAGVPLAEAGRAFLLGLATMTRVIVLIAIASAIWVPIGVWIGLRPNAARVVQPVAQFMAAFPANLLFPLAVSAIVAFRLDPDVWLSPLMILGTQWYILFNVIAGASTIPSELRDIGTNLRVRGWLWWRRIALPAVFPFYLTGAITASGGSWNASIVAEIASWGQNRLQAHGLGAYIAEATQAGDFHRVVLGIAVMSAFVVVINRTFWRPLYARAERKFRLG